jgi:hypothetical protein
VWVVVHKKEKSMFYENPVFWASIIGLVMWVLGVAVIENSKIDPNECTCTDPEQTTYDIVYIHCPIHGEDHESI